MIIDISQSKPPLKLFVQIDGGFKEQLEAHACGECKNIAPSEQAARECHGIRRCDCGEAIAENYYTACAACRAKHDQERDAAQLANAKRVPESSASALYCMCCERFFYDGAAELIETHQQEDREIPEFAEACEERGLTFDTERVLADAIESAEFDSETSSDHFGAADVLELDLLLKEWLARHPLANHFPTGDLVDLRPVAVQP